MEGEKGEIIRCSDTIYEGDSWIIVTNRGECVQIDTLRDESFAKMKNNDCIPLFSESRVNTNGTKRFRRNVKQRIRSGRTVMPVTVSFRQLLACLALYVFFCGPRNLASMQLTACAFAILLILYSVETNQLESYVSKTEFR
mmetsp:Transcript_8265/g.9767  ORF Transcript_8265/g.9767 Transcript_8265/m.9767 type:complete len:141 (+) Transcript_8265:292-714(+)